HRKRRRTMDSSKASTKAHARRNRGVRAHASQRPVKAATRRWSAKVMRTSNALDLEGGVFKGSARAIAASLKRSAEASRRRKSTPFRSAMSMLNFHLNRSGKGLTAERRRTLEAAKQELRRLFHHA